MSEPIYHYDPSEEEITRIAKAIGQFGLTEQESKRFIDVMEKKSMRKRIVYELNDKLRKLKKQQRSKPSAHIRLSIVWNNFKLVLVDWDNSLTTDYRLEQLNKKREL